MNGAIHWTSKEVVQRGGGILSSAQVRHKKKWHEAFAIDMANKQSNGKCIVHGTTSCKCF